MLQPTRIAAVLIAASFVAGCSYAVFGPGYDVLLQRFREACLGETAA